MTRRFWTPEEIKALTELYPDATASEASASIGRSVSGIHGMAAKLGIRKSKAFYLSQASGRLESAAGLESRFKKGSVPWNKGKSHPPRGRSAETQFKKGEMTGAAQHNYVPIGSLRVTKYGSLERKVTDDPDLYPARRWRPVAHLVWEAANGPIPAKHVVRFLPGMATTVEAEITIDRLECISLAENMRRNSLHRYPKEIANAIQLRSALNRRINSVEKQNNR